MESLSTISIKGFIEASFVDWPGKLCSVLFFPNCNFRCRYCHNEALVTRPHMLEDIPFSRIMDYLDSHRAWIDGVCLSGGEITLQPRLAELLRYFKKRGFLTKIDTNGSNPSILGSLLEQGLLDYVAMDVKATLDQRSYCSITQSENALESVKQSIALLMESTVEHEFRITVVPSYHGPEEVLEIARYLNGASRLRIQNFNPASVLDPNLQNLKPFDEGVISSLQRKVNEIIAA